MGVKLNLSGLQRIGLTGGIGSGKSTVARMLAASGASVVHADAISRQLTAVGGSAMPGIASQFGRHMLTAEGALNRERMRQLVFDDPSAKQRLQALLHPLVRQQALRQAEQAAQAGGRCIVFDIPLLVESDYWRQQVDQVLVVDCSEATQIARVMARDGLTREMVLKIMAGQASREQRLSAADICINNDGLSIEALGVLVQQLAARFGL